MPTYRFQAPNGKPYRINSPVKLGPEQLRAVGARWAASQGAPPPAQRATAPEPPDPLDDPDGWRAWRATQGPAGGDFRTGANPFHQVVEAATLPFELASYPTDRLANRSLGIEPGASGSNSLGVVPAASLGVEALLPEEVGNTTGLPAWAVAASGPAAPALLANPIVGNAEKLAMRAGLSPETAGVPRRLLRKVFGLGTGVVTNPATALGGLGAVRGLAGVATPVEQGLAALGVVQGAGQVGHGVETVVEAPTWTGRPGEEGKLEGLLDIGLGGAMTALSAHGALKARSKQAVPSQQAEMVSESILDDNSRAAVEARIRAGEAASRPPDLFQGDTQDALWRAGLLPESEQPQAGTGLWPVAQEGIPTREAATASGRPQRVPPTAEAQWDALPLEGQGQAPLELPPAEPFGRRPELPPVEVMRAPQAALESLPDSALDGDSLAMMRDRLRDPDTRVDPSQFGLDPAPLRAAGVTHPDGTVDAAIVERLSRERDRRVSSLGQPSAPEAQAALDLQPEARAGERRVEQKPTAIEQRRQDRRAALQQKYPDAAPALVDRAAQASEDDLTGLGNKRAWKETEPTIDPDNDHVLFVDLRQFKPFNDKMGHGVGDQVLQHVAGRVLEHAGNEAARLGGDEFGGVLRGVSDPVEAQARATALQDDLRGTPFEITMPDGSKLDIPGVEVHIGVGRGRGANATAAADAALNAGAEQSRAGGRGDVAIPGVGPGERGSEPGAAGRAEGGRQGDKGRAQGRLAPSPVDEAGVRILPGEEHLPTADRSLVDQLVDNAVEDLRRREAQVKDDVHHGADAELAAVGLEDLVAERRNVNDSRVEDALRDLHGDNPTRRAARMREMARSGNPLEDVPASLAEIEAARKRDKGNALEMMVREAVRRSDPAYAEAAERGVFDGDALEAAPTEVVEPPAPTQPKEGQMVLASPRQMLQGVEARVTEGREASGPLFTQEADARARAAEKSQGTLLDTKPTKAEPLEGAAAAARVRIARRKQELADVIKAGGKEAGAAPNLTADLLDYSILGAHHIAKGAKNLGEFTTAMSESLGRKLSEEEAGYLYAHAQQMHRGAPLQAGGEAAKEIPGQEANPPRSELPQGEEMLNETLPRPLARFVEGVARTGPVGKEIAQTVAHRAADLESWTADTHSTFASALDEFAGKTLSLPELEGRGKTGKALYKRFVEEVTPLIETNAPVPDTPAGKVAGAVRELMNDWRSRLEGQGVKPEEGWNDDGYWPHMAEDESAYTPEARARRLSAESGGKLTPQEAMEKLAKTSAPPWKRALVTKEGNVDIARQDVMENWRRDPGVVFEYVHQAARRAADQKYFGQGSQRIEGLLRQMRLEDPEAAQYARTGLTRLAGHELPSQMSRASTTARNVVSGTALVTAPAAQLGSIINTIGFAGVRRTAIGLWKTLGKGEGASSFERMADSLHKAQRENTGAIYPNLAQEMAIEFGIGKQATSTLSKKISQGVAKLPYIRGISHFDGIQRVIASETAKAALPSWLEQAKAGDRVAQSRFKQAGVDWKKLDLDKPADVNFFGKKVADYTQHRTDVANSPLWISHPLGKLVGMYKNFGIQQTRFMARMASEPGGASKLFKLAAAGALIGEGVRDLKDAARGYGIQGEDADSWSEAWETAKKGGRVSWEHPIIRMAQNLAVAGAFGLAEDLVNKLSARERVKGLVYGPVGDATIGQADRVLDAASKDPVKGVKEGVAVAMRYGIPLVGREAAREFTADETLPKPGWVGHGMDVLAGKETIGEALKRGLVTGEASPERMKVRTDAKADKRKSEAAAELKGIRGERPAKPRDHELEALKAEFRTELAKAYQAKNMDQVSDVLRRAADKGVPFSRASIIELVRSLPQGGAKP